MKKQLKKLVSVVLIMVSFAGFGMSQVRADSLDDLKEGITKVTEVTGDKLEQIKIAVGEKFSDYSVNEWYADYAAKLVAVNGITGYPDNTFKPSGTITKAEFTKILIASIYGIQTPPTDSHWAIGYIDKAEDVGILSSGEFLEEVWDKPINRQEMAKMIVLASEKVLDEEDATNLDDIEAMVFDSDEIGTSYKNYVLSAYSKGILSGYPDKTFKPLNTATRAEACTMLVKLLDSSIRDVPGNADWETTIINGYVVPEDESIIKYSWHTQEEIDKGYCEMALYVNLAARTSLLDQWAAVEQALTSQFSAKVVKEAMDYAKLKTVDAYVLECKEIYEGDRFIRIISNMYNAGISIQVYYK